MTIQEAFETLLRTYGTHSAAARALSINISYYRDLRNGRVSIPPRTKEFLLLKAVDCQNPKVEMITPTATPSSSAAPQPGEDAALRATQPAQGQGILTAGTGATSGAEALPR